MSFINNMNSPIVENVAIAVVHGCSNRGMLVYPNMLLVSKSPSDIWTLPVIPLNTCMGEADPFDAITSGMFEEYGIRVTMIKWIHTEKDITTIKNRKRCIHMDYFDVRVAGQIKRKSRRYKESMYRNYVALPSLAHKSIGLARWIDEIIRRKKKKEHDAVSYGVAVEKMTGSPILNPAGTIHDVTPINDYMRLISPINQHIDYTKLQKTTARTAKLNERFPQIDDWKGLL